MHSEKYAAADLSDQHQEVLLMGTVLDDLKDLHGQATAERSHYYVANTALRAIKHIEELEEALEAMAKVIARRERK